MKLPANVNQYLGNVLSGITLAAVLWVGTGISEISATIKVHEWRLQALEGKPA